MEMKENNNLINRFYSVCKKKGIYKNSKTGKNKIRALRFAFKNKEIIKFLQKRGSYLKNAKFTEAEAIENKINTYKNENLDEIVTPVHAFVLFEHEVAHNTALKDYAKDAFSFCKSIPLSV